MFNRRKDLAQTGVPTKELSNRGFVEVKFSDPRGKNPSPVMARFVREYDKDNSGEKIIVYEPGKKEGTWDYRGQFIESDLAIIPPRKTFYPKKQTPPEGVPLSEKRGSAMSLLRRLEIQRKQEERRILSKIFNQSMEEIQKPCVVAEEDLKKRGYISHNRISGCYLKSYVLEEEGEERTYTAYFRERGDGRYELEKIVDRTREVEKKRREQERVRAERILRQRGGGLITLD